MTKPLGVANLRSTSEAMAGTTDAQVFFRMFLHHWRTDSPKKGVYIYTLQETNISHLGKRKIIFKYALSGGYVSSLDEGAYMKYYVYKYLENGSDLLKDGKSAKKILPGFLFFIGNLA